MQGPAVSCSMGLKPMLTDEEASVIIGNGDSKEEDYFGSATPFDLMDGQVKLGYYHIRTLRDLIKRVCGSQCNGHYELIKWNTECRM